MARISQAQIFALYRAVAAYEGEPFRTLADACNHFSEAIGFQVAPKTFRTTMLECGKSLITHAHFGKHRPRREKNDVDVRLAEIREKLGQIQNVINMLQNVDNTLSSRVDKVEQVTTGLHNRIHTVDAHHVDRFNKLSNDQSALSDRLNHIVNDIEKRFEKRIVDIENDFEKRINQLETQARNALEP